MSWTWPDTARNWATAKVHFWSLNRRHCQCEKRAIRIPYFTIKVDKSHKGGQLRYDEVDDFYTCENEDEYNHDLPPRENLFLPWHSNLTETFTNWWRNGTDGGKAIHWINPTIWFKKTTTKTMKPHFCLGIVFSDDCYAYYTLRTLRRNKVPVNSLLTRHSYSLAPTSLTSHTHSKSQIR